jgi:hypothetical protein
VGVIALGHRIDTEESADLDVETEFLGDFSAGAGHGGFAAVDLGYAAGDLHLVATARLDQQHAPLLIEEQHPSRRDGHGIPAEEPALRGGVRVSGHPQRLAGRRYHLVPQPRLRTANAWAGPSAASGAEIGSTASHVVLGNPYLWCR